jgi:hypothetical protein
LSNEGLGREKTMTADNVSLEMTAGVSNGVLQVSYVLANHGSMPLVVYDGAKGPGEDAYPDLAGQCYISYSPPDVARVLRIRPPVHPFKDTTRTFMPPVSEVAPGGRREVRFRLSLPLKERSEFTPDFAGAVYEKEPVKMLELRIGCFWKTPDTVLRPLSVPDVWAVVKGAPLSRTFEVSAVSKVSFEMLVRTDSVFIRM